MQHPVFLQVSVISQAVLSHAPMSDAVRESRGDYFTTERVPFQYYEPTSITVSFVRPQGGPSSGATHVEVHGAASGQHGSNNLKCRFPVLVPLGWGCRRLLPQSKAYQLFIPHHHLSNDALQGSMSLLTGSITPGPTTISQFTRFSATHMHWPGHYRLQQSAISTQSAVQPVEEPS